MPPLPEAREGRIHVSKVDQGDFTVVPPNDRRVAADLALSAASPDREPMYRPCFVVEGTIQDCVAGVLGLDAHGLATALMVIAQTREISRRYADKTIGELLADLKQHDYAPDALGMLSRTVDQAAAWLYIANTRRTLASLSSIGDPTA